ncbi:hypothetical protein NLG97_g9174 [Lecanicillium saksenae]|uniref:Uncharacterized protein n=1 Tax=Lecanicillium saksenae TaxID=468837 RepID=A0ACC1QIG3_9HYPO|nr:hypothetical protein NLG97_g9174 [Lecanicillium saksenae]
MPKPHYNHTIFILTGPSFSKYAFSKLCFALSALETATAHLVHRDAPYKKGQHTLNLLDGTVCPSYNEKQWTGTVDVSDEHRLFFWAFESRHDPANDPVIVFLGGGPGQSGLGYAIQEGGSCRLSKSTGNDPIPNPWAWNNNATVVYLDQPATVGFSSSTTGRNIFFRDIFPQKAHLPVNIAGRSYGAHYAAAYARYIVDARRDNSTEAFTGDLASLVLLNPILDWGAIIGSTYEFYCVNKITEGIFSREECEAMLAPSAKLEKMALRCESTLLPADCKDMYKYGDENVLSYIFSHKDLNQYYIGNLCEGASTCNDRDSGNKTEYFNRASVKKALGVPASREWIEFNQDIESACSNSSTMYISRKADLAAALDGYQTLHDGNPLANTRILVISGNNGGLFTTEASDLTLQRTIWTRMVDYRSTKWHSFTKADLAVDGEFKATRDGRLALVAMDNTGHSPAKDQPEGTYRVLQRWLEDGFHS